MSCPCCRLLSVSILNVLFASLVPFPFRKPYWSSPIHSSFSALLCNLFVSTLNITLDACVSRLMVLWSAHSVAFGFFFIGTIMVCKKSSGHSPVLYISLHICISSVIASSPRVFSISLGILSVIISAPTASSCTISSSSSQSLFLPSSLLYSSSIYSFHLSLISCGSCSIFPLLLLIVVSLLPACFLVSFFIFPYTRSCLPIVCNCSSSAPCSSHHFSFALFFVFLMW